MYPLLPLGPFRLSTGGLLLLLALFLGQVIFTRLARRHAGAALAETADVVFFAALIGGALGARLWYALLNLDLYSRTPSQLWALRLADWAWPGALLGGVLAAWLFCRWRGYQPLVLADLAGRTLPLPQAVASLGLLFSGEAFGAPTALPWAVSLFGTQRHPTQIYYVLMALLSFALLLWLSRNPRPPGWLAASALGLQGVTFVLIEALRGDSLLLPGGVRATQVVGLALMLAAMLWLRRLAGGEAGFHAKLAEHDSTLQEQV